jgi:serine/threonine-protein kinase RsbW
MMTQNAETPIHTVPSVVTLVIPCQAEFVSVARLTMLGIGSRLPWSTDDVEDLRLAVAEVCVDAIDRANQHDPESVSGLTIEIIAMIAHDKVIVDIRDHVPPAAAASISDPKEKTGEWLIHDRESVSDALIEALVDKFERSQELGGTVVRLVKYIPKTEG